ncbi:MAG: SusC/RagA family TonB-linked outer membrane protein [Gemmatimonadota bacterium]
MTTRIGFRAILCALATLALFSAEAAYAQQTGIVQGVVIDASTSRPVIGAQVYIPGTSLGTLTNTQGRYHLSAVPAGQQTLSVELIGYATLSRQITVTAGQTTNANLSVEPAAVALQEIVATGVSGGAVERAKVPFSVSRVDTDQMPVQGVSALNQLQGKVPGANIASTTGRPGTSPSVVLRGPTSINASGRSQEPLYIVDGVVLGASIADLNPADIESVEIVKGAAASTLYGSRAAGGVIAITTKRGSRAGSGVRFTTRYELGFGDIERDFGIARFHPFLLDETGTRFCVVGSGGINDAYGSPTACSRTLDYRTEQARINNAPGDFALAPPSFPVDPGAVLSGPQTRRVFLAGQWPGKVFNAVDQLVDPKPIALNDASMSGRVGATTFFTSFGHTKQGGAIMGLKGYERLNGRVNLGHRFGDQWTVDVNSYISRAELDGSNQEEGGGGFFRLTRTPAIVDITQRDNLGRLFIRTNLFSGGTQNENPLYSFENVVREDVRHRYIVGGTVRYTPLTWLDADANFSVDRLNFNFLQFENKGFRTTNNNPTTNQGRIFNGVTNNQSLNGAAGVTLRPNLFEQLNSRVQLRWLYERQDEDFRRIQGRFLRVADVQAGENATQQQEISSSVGETRQMSFSGGLWLDFRDRYTVDLAVRRDGSSRFGADNRWQTYGRASAAWLMAREEWFPSDRISAFTLRGSYGTAGNTPRYSAQYETFSIGAGGTLTAQTLGNPALRPEVVTEVEVGTDLELFSRYGLTLTYANSLAKDQILEVPVSVATGFPRQWQNAGELRNKTWEAALTVPILRNTAGVTWTARANYTSNRSVIEKLFVQPFFIGSRLQATSQIIRIAEGERYGTLYGWKFMTDCSQLPGNFASQCGGPTSAFQKNDEGWLVWVGEGNNPRMGITHNLWNAALPAAQAPFGVETSFGMPILVRDPNSCAPPPSGCTPLQSPLGHATPDYRLGMSHTIQYKKFSLYGLVDGAFGQSIWNQGRHWSYLDFLSNDIDQRGKSVETAKPIGYYYRRGPGAAGSSGIGGFYDVLAPNSRFVEDASFLKLREVSASYNVGRISNFGDWTVSVIGRNLKTWTDYEGFDPEVGISGGESNTGLINAIDAFTFPQVRTLSFVLSSSF